MILQLARSSLFPYTTLFRSKVEERDISNLREQLLAPRFNFAAPRVHATELGVDGSLTLTHEHKVDGRGLDLERARRVLEYIHRVWRRPVYLHTTDEHGEEEILAEEQG